jgi:hypothetical protein
MSLVINRSGERLVKSADRIRDLGEVFTPTATVQEMLDLLPASIWKPHPSATFLEPACGNGNFLVAILDRKLAQISKVNSRGKLPAGDHGEAAQYHGLEALSSIYAVDISEDNVIGGTSGHEIGARARLLAMFAEWNHEQLGKALSDQLRLSAEWIIEHNIIVGNMLPTTAEGKPTGRDDLPLIDYSWTPETMGVSVSKTTLGAVVAAEKAETAAEPSLFGPTESEFIFMGKAFSLNQVDRVAAPALTSPARNGNGRSAW